MLLYTLSFSAIGIDYTDGYDCGFKWNMTCGNDSIQGGVSSGVQPSEVPEPASLVLLGLASPDLRRAVKQPNQRKSRRSN